MGIVTLLWSAPGVIGFNCPMGRVMVLWLGEGDGVRLGEGDGVGLGEGDGVGSGVGIIMQCWYSSAIV